ncbi:MAG: histidine kinase [Bacteroidia bacterium]|nr:histidine kinase [Bacteroidia bacterium]
MIFTIRHLFLFIFCFNAVCNVTAQDCDCKDLDKYKQAFNRQSKIFSFDSINNTLKNVDLNGALACKALYNNLSANLAYKLSNYKAAKSFLAKENKILRSQKCPETKYIDNYYLTGLLNSDQDQHDSAATYLLKTLKLAEESGYNEIIPKIYHSLAGVFAKLGELDRSLDLIQKAIAINKRSDNFYLLANNYSTLSSVFVVMSVRSKIKADFSDSSFYAQELGFKYARQSSNVDALLSLYYKRATLLTRTKDFKNAEKYLDSSISLSIPKAHVKNLCGAYSHKAFLFSQLRNYDKAIQFNDSSLKYARILGATSSIIGIYKFAYENYSKSGDFKNALRAHEQMMSYSDSLNLIEKTKAITELEKKYDQVKNEKTINELNQQTEIDKLRIRSLFAFGTITLLIIVVIIFFYRQSIVKNKLKTIETEQRLNRARMNPHFFFNALASLQNLSLSENKKEFVPIFISKFSRIMRQSLESTFNELDTIENEIAFLTDYLELQKLLSENRFNYNFKVDDAIESSELLIPGMILQPFIENSIEHGFKTISYEGLIELSFVLSGDSLKITITDNGGGIKKVEKNKNYPSRATQIIKDRLFLLNKTYKTNATFVLTNSDSDKGIVVEISLPIIYK